MDKFTFIQYGPFSSLIDNMPSASLHVKKVNAWAGRYAFGDFGQASMPLNNLMIDDVSLGDPEEHNLDNAMEA